MLKGKWMHQMYNEETMRWPLTNIIFNINSSVGMKSQAQRRQSKNQHFTALQKHIQHQM